MFENCYAISWLGARLIITVALYALAVGLLTWMWAMSALRVVSKNTLLANVLRVIRKDQKLGGLSG